MTEIGAHRGADTIGAATEVHGVEVALEYLLLREVLLELDREHRLLDLAGEGALAREVDVLDVLLRDRRPALRAAFVAKV